MANRSKCQNNDENEPHRTSPAMGKIAALSPLGGEEKNITMSKTVNSPFNILKSMTPLPLAPSP